MTADVSKASPDWNSRLTDRLSAELHLSLVHSQVQVSIPAGDVFSQLSVVPLPHARTTDCTPEAVALYFEHVDGHEIVRELADESNGSLQLEQ